MQIQKFPDRGAAAKISDSLYKMIVLENLSNHSFAEFQQVLQNIKSAPPALLKPIS
jgi:hypothetical protein